MHIHSAYCSARDQNVRVAMTEEPTHDGQANLHDVEVICLDYGEHCTGDFCPGSGAQPFEHMTEAAPTLQ